MLKRIPHSLPNVIRQNSSHLQAAGNVDVAVPPVMRRLVSLLQAAAEDSMASGRLAVWPSGLLDICKKKKTAASCEAEQHAGSADHSDSSNVCQPVQEKHQSSNVEAHQSSQVVSSSRSRRCWLHCTEYQARPLWYLPPVSKCRSTLKLGAKAQAVAVMVQTPVLCHSAGVSCMAGTDLCLSVCSS